MCLFLFFFFPSYYRWTDFGRHKTFTLFWISLDGIIPLFFALDLSIILDGIKPTSIFFLSISFVVLDFLKFSCVLLLCRYFLLVICSYFLAFHLAPDFGYNKFYITFSICFFYCLRVVTVSVRVLIVGYGRV